MNSIFPIVNHQEEVEAAYTPANPPTVTITSSSSTASIDIIPASSDGTFVTSVPANEVTFGVTTDNLTGYTIAVAARSGDTSGQLTNASYGDTLDTITSPVNETTFAYDTTGAYVNKWGLKSSKYNTSTSTWDPLASGNYLPAPKTSDTVLDTTTSPNSTPIQYRVGVGARVNYNKPSGTYTNTYTLQAVGNQISYSITYADTSSDSVPVPAADAHSNITASKFTLDTAIPSRTNWVFVGWCDGTISHPSNNNSTCTGTPGIVYQPGDDYTFPNMSSPTTTLRAMWGVPIQNLTTSLCTTTARTVYDVRDRQAYIVQKLADNNCWMMNNLNLGATNLTTNLTSSNTNISTAVTAATFNSWKVSAGTINYTSGEFIPLTTANSADGRDTDPTTGTKYGVLYNFYATSGGTISGSVNYSNASYDICPSGWRLPTGGSTGEFQNLYNQSAYNTPAKMHAPISSGGAAFAFAGGFDANNITTGEPFSQGSGSLYWSLTRSNDTSMYNLGTTSTTTSPTNTGGRWVGRSIRCIRKGTTTSGITNMQQITPSIVANTAEGVAGVTLKDSRDNQTYSVRKIGGDVWMTRNLAIGCNGSAGTYGSGYSSRTLTSAASNVSTSFATPTTTLNGQTTANSLATPYMTCSTSYGAWYNFATASAGTIKGTSSTVSSTYDICPLGWNLPSKVKINSILGSANLGGFSLQTGGYYTSSSAASTSTLALSSTDRGIWWSSTYRANNNSMEAITYNSTNYTTGGGAHRSAGFYVRCVAK